MMELPPALVLRASPGTTKLPVIVEILSQLLLAVAVMGIYNVAGQREPEL